LRIPHVKNPHSIQTPPMSSETEFKLERPAHLHLRRLDEAISKAKDEFIHCEWGKDGEVFCRSFKQLFDSICERFKLIFYLYEEVDLFERIKLTEEERVALGSFSDLRKVSERQVNDIQANMGMFEDALDEARMGQLKMEIDKLHL
jgi:hypothetical protein